MLVFTVKSTEISVKSGVSAKGRPYELHEQYALVDLGEERRKVAILLETGQQPYVPGQYEIDPASFVVDQYNSLGVKLRLRPIKAAVRGVG
jgi:hypothetical protein